MRVLDLFSGIGGFSLGLERAGMQTVAFCEIDPFCRKILAKHWPTVRQYEDVRTLTSATLSRDGISVDAICGGFPCQDISLAGKGAGIEGNRSGLWSQYARIIGEIRPRIVVVENVAALLGRGIYRVLGDLAALGYGAWWDCIPASAVGAPHRRDRVWIVAYPDDSSGARFGQHGGEILSEQKPIRFGGSGKSLANTGRGRCNPPQKWQVQQSRRAETIRAGETLAYAIRAGLQERLMQSGVSGQAGCDDAGQDSLLGSWWFVEPNVGRVADGISGRVDRLRSLGNAVVPQIPEIIGRAILKAAE
jgi:DNA (cytosine-5)-methyltransferase 1